MIQHRVRLLALLLFFPVAASLHAQEGVPEVARSVFDEAERHRAAGRRSEAVQAYEEVLRLAPEVVPAYVALGALYTGENQLEKALGTFAAGLQRAPAEPTLLFNAAVVAQRLGQLDGALDYASRALAENRKDPQLLALQASILRRLDRSQEALRALETARDEAPNDPRILFSLGNLYHELARRDEAIEAYRRALRRDKNLLRARYNLGAVLFEEERYDEAEKEYGLALAPIDQAFARGEEVPPEHARAYLNLGAIYYRKRDWARAVEAYTKSLRLDPDQATAHYNLGYIHFQQGNESGAFQAYRRALELDDTLPLAYLHLSQIHHRRGESEAAVQALEKGLPLLGADDAHTARLLLAESYDRLGRSTSAEAAYRAVLATDAQETRALAGLGGLLRRSGRLDEARPLLEAARRSSPEDDGLALQLAAIARAGGDLARERELYETILTMRPGSSDLWSLELNLAVLALRQGDLDEAQKRLAPLVSRLEELLQPRLGADLAPKMTTLYALLLARQGATRAARAELQRSLAADAGFAPAIHASAALDAIAGRYDTAARGLLRILEAGSLSPEVSREVRGELGLVLWWGSGSQEARRHLAAAAGAFPDWLEVRAALGEVYLAAGSNAAAIEQLTAAATLCRSPERESGRGELAPGHFRVSLIAAPRGRQELCSRVEPHLANALVRASFEDLAQSSRSASARTRANQALGLTLDPTMTSVAHFVRGTALLAAGDADAGRRDLQTALDASSLPESLRPLVQNNLAVALHSLDEATEARRHLEAAQRDARAPLAVSLNMGILLDEAQSNRAALSLYEAYVDGGGSRRDEVDGWIDRLRRLSP